MSDRDYPSRPWVGVGVVVWRDDSVLLIQRGSSPRKGQWSIPGGMQQVGETVRAAGIREVREETGIDIAIDGLVDVVDAIMHDAGRVRTHYSLVDFYGHWIAGDVIAGDDAAVAKWVPHASLGEYGLWSETLRIIETSRRLRGQNTET